MRIAAILAFVTLTGFFTSGLVQKAFSDVPTVHTAVQPPRIDGWISKAHLSKSGEVSIDVKIINISDNFVTVTLAELNNALPQSVRFWPEHSDVAVGFERTNCALYDNQFIHLAPGASWNLSFSWVPSPSFQPYVEMMAGYETRTRKTVDAIEGERFAVSLDLGIYACAGEISSYSEFLRKSQWVNVGSKNIVWLARDK